MFADNFEKPKVRTGKFSWAQSRRRILVRDQQAVKPSCIPPLGLQVVIFSKYSMISIATVRSMARQTFLSCILLPD